MDSVESKPLKAQALIALLLALGGWIALYLGYSLHNWRTLLAGGVALTVGLAWLLAALVIGYVRQRSA